jgi:hypothetical protein
MYKKMYKFQEWDNAIAEAERLMRDAKSVAQRLRATIKHFKAMREAGEPFPGSGQHASEGNAPRVQSR